MSPIKEPTFFNIEGVSLDQSLPDHQIAIKNGIKSIDDYLSLFKGVYNEKAIGEASTGYLPSARAADRIKHYIPDAKLIAILRDPVDRAYSNFLMYVRWGIETFNDFDQAINKNKTTRDIYINLGFYYRQLKRYFELFKKSHIRVYFYEDLKSDSVGLVHDIFSFLNVNETFIPDTSQKHNVSVLQKNRTIHTLLSKDTIVKGLLKPFIPERLRRSMRNNFMQKNVGKPKLKTKIRRKLINIYSEDIIQLQTLIQRDLSKWLE